MKYLMLWIAVIASSAASASTIVRYKSLRNVYIGDKAYSLEHELILPQQELVFTPKTSVVQGQTCHATGNGEGECDPTGSLEGIIEYSVKFASVHIAFRDLDSGQIVAEKTEDLPDFKIRVHTDYQDETSFYLTRSGLKAALNGAKWLLNFDQGIDLNVNIDGKRKLVRVSSGTIFPTVQYHPGDEHSMKVSLDLEATNQRVTDEDRGLPGAKGLEIAVAVYGLQRTIDGYEERKLEGSTLSPLEYLGSSVIGGAQ